MLRLVTLAGLLCASGSFVADAETAQSTENTARQDMYTCERGVEVPVAFIQNDGETVAIAHVDGKQIIMSQVQSGSGALYRSIDDTLPIEFFTKGKAGLFSYGFDGDSVTFLQDCVAS